MKDLMKKVALQVKEKGKRLGTFADSVDSAKYLLSLGFEYLAYSVDINIFLEAAQNIRKSLIQK
jgi:4-hydroxy-2-oxoheptanedioate aldolase